MNYNELLKAENNVLNYEGGEAFKMTPEMELYTAVVTAALAPTTYENVDERIVRICELVQKCSAVFVAKLAVYTRTQMNLRSTPLLLVTELARVHNGDDLVSRTVEKVILRADEIMELLTCYQMRNAEQGSVKKLNRLSKQIQIGLIRAFNKFDEYQFAKYNRDAREVTLRDALFIVHPKAKDEQQQKIFDKIAGNTLETPYTWETELSALGRQAFDSPEEKAEAFSKKWQELVASGKLGYMALMRNLRNILRSKDVPANTINTIVERLTDPNAIANSRQLPFRYLAAFREVVAIESPWSQLVLNSLEIAVLQTADTITGFDENTSVLVAADVSGSMFTPVSPKSSIRNFDIGLLLSMILKSRCRNVIGGIFGTTWRTINIPSTGILSAVQEMYKREGVVGYATNGHEVIRWMIESDNHADKILMFTDCQMWNSSGDNNSMMKQWQIYKQLNPKSKLYLFDLAGYGQSPVLPVAKDVYLIAGWSDRVFDILSALENGKSVVEEINDIVL